METRTMTRRSLRTRWVGGAVVAAEIIAGAAWAAPVPVRVEVKADTLDPKHAKTIGPSVREAVAGVLRDEHGVAVEADANTTLAVELRPIVEPTERDKVIFRVTVLEGGKEIHAGKPTSCWGCDEAKLLASVRTEVAGVVEHLPAQAQPPTPAEASPPAASGGTQAEPTDTNAPGTTDTSTSNEGPTPSPPVMLRNLGIGLTAAGTALAGVGIGLAIANERVVESNEEREAVRELRPTGITLAVAGGAVLVSGAVALVVYGMRKKRASQTTWAPIGGPGFVGVTIERRF